MARQHCPPPPYVLPSEQACARPNLQLAVGAPALGVKAPRRKAARTGSGTRLAIVELPAKARTDAGLLCVGYVS